MNNFLKKMVDQGFMTEGQGNYIEESIMRKDCLIISGHRGWGILPLMAAAGAVAKGSFKIKQVKGFEDLKEETDYFLIADLIGLKDPDHPYSILKILGDVYKADGPTAKVLQVLECAKINDEKKLSKITQITMNENGKLAKVDFKE
mgnify:CR=1 FL=1